MDRTSSVICCLWAKSEMVSKYGPFCLSLAYDTANDCPHDEPSASCSLNPSSCQWCEEVPLIWISKAKGLFAGLCAFEVDGGKSAIWGRMPPDVFFSGFPCCWSASETHILSFQNWLVLYLWIYPLAFKGKCVPQRPVIFWKAPVKWETSLNKWKGTHICTCKNKGSQFVNEKNNHFKKDNWSFCEEQVPD